MTTVARHRKPGQRGQSLVEFSFMVPLIIGTLVFMRQVNMAINSSIVNQKYARATLHFLTFNHRWYPEARYTQRTAAGLYMHRWWVGVENDKTDGDEADSKAPVAPTIDVGRQKGPDDDGQGLPTTGRKNIRIRSNSFICLPPFGTKIGQIFSQGPNGMPNDAFLDGQGFQYCLD
ncbi:MAG: hypothetical protein HY074_10025 [Deltaproteobacteria bacterium]|nr:hypothetical protein [Deltaproteobacteria bacterium]